MLNLRNLTLALAVLILLFCTQVEAASRVFNDGFESGNTNLWDQDDYRDKCTVVTSAADGIVGPYAGTKMARCNSNGTVAKNSGPAFETLVINSIAHTNEIFYRTRFRVDQNLEKTTISPKKIIRIFVKSPSDTDSYFALYSDAGCVNSVVIANNTDISTYWGNLDNCSDTSTWHKAELYFNYATGNVKEWIDGILIRNVVSPFNGTEWYPFYLTSNWEDAHDTTNYVYFDEFEIYSDNGTGATGSMSSATISAGGGPVTIPNAPSNAQMTIN